MTQLVDRVYDRKKIQEKKKKNIYLQIAKKSGIKKYTILLPNKSITNPIQASKIGLFSRETSQ